jgi:fatty aldehyde-generating acyl-ACP reductase
MKFATLSHLLNQDNLKFIPKSWIKDNLIVSPELDVMGTKGYVVALKLLPQQIMSLPADKIKQIILDAAVFTQEKLDVEILQLGALTTSVTNGGAWLVKQEKYNGLVTHGDSYTAAVTCQAVMKSLNLLKKEPSEQILAIVGSYGIIGEAVSKILVPQFSHSVLIGRRKEKLKELASKLEGSFNTTTNLETKNADVVITATSHPTALLESEHLKEKAIIVDVSQPVNLSAEVCKRRTDVIRVDGGYADFPIESPLPIPGLPPGKTFACIAEVIMQAMENERENHVGSIDLNYLYKTERWAEKYGFLLNELTNFGQSLNLT